jgi:hypothetical protein
MADKKTDKDIPKAEEIPEEGKAVSDEKPKTATDNDAETATTTDTDSDSAGLASKKLLLMSSGILALLIVLSSVLIYFTLQMEFNTLFENQQQAANKKSPLANDVNHLITLNNDIYDTLYNLSEQIQARVNAVSTDTLATKKTMNDVIDAVVELQTLVNKNSGKTTVAMKRLRQHLSQIKKDTQSTQSNMGNLQKTLEKLRNEPVRVISEVVTENQKTTAKKRRRKTNKRQTIRAKEPRRKPKKISKVVSPIAKPSTTQASHTAPEPDPYINNNPFFGSSIINAPPVSWNILPAID